MTSAQISAPGPSRAAPRGASDEREDEMLLGGYTAEEEAEVVRKFDRKLVLFVALLYMLSFLDRSSKRFLPLSPLVLSPLAQPRRHPPPARLKGPDEQEK